MTTDNRTNEPSHNRIKIRAFRDGEVSIIHEDQVLGLACTLDELKRAVATYEARAALTTAGVAPHEPNQNETKSGNNFVSLDAEKVAEVIEQMRDRAHKERDVTKESLGQFIARALCEAYTEGKLT